jgi:hypothetical protein
MERRKLAEEAVGALVRLTAGRPASYTIEELIREALRVMT